MSHDFCFTLPNGDEICIPIFVIPRQFWEDPNPPDPLSKIDMTSIRTLATIDSLAESLSEDVGRSIRGLVADQMQAMTRSLGSNVRIRQHGHAARAA